MFELPSTIPAGCIGFGPSASTSTRCSQPTHHTIYATQFVDIDAPRLLDVVENRSAASVSTWLGGRTRYFRDHIEVAAIDPHAG